MEVMIFTLISLLHSLLVNPIQSLFRRETERFEYLKTFRLDGMLRELISGGDFLSSINNKASEWEMQNIAYHISERCALGAVDDEEFEKVFEIFPLRLFWIYRNGYTARMYNVGLAFGFYLGVGITALIFWLI